MIVRELMTTDVVSCEATGSLQPVVETMLTESVGSVVVTREGVPAGIFTETDVLRATAHTERPLAEIPIHRVASHPLVTTRPNASIRRAVETMTDNDVKKLPVVDDSKLVGILTQSDIVAHYSDFIREAHRLDAMSGQWEE
ncbi:CBS domain-containing protein [Halobaculum limi]|uniref:CBS domain-containing protein n=1 Tax=Halobaculum limi TaxID=3031916 RepID=UPI002406C545|nr:CBS domain-containing protein [Halobaculum sp. YSMS11]